jgi:hypothetical protein
VLVVDDDRCRPRGHRRHSGSERKNPCRLIAGDQPARHRYRGPSLRAWITDVDRREEDAAAWANAPSGSWALGVGSRGWPTSTLHPVIWSAPATTLEATRGVASSAAGAECVQYDSRVWTTSGHAEATEQSGAATRARRRSMLELTARAVSMPSSCERVWRPRESPTRCGHTQHPRDGYARARRRGLTPDPGHAESSIVLGKRDDPVHGQEELQRRLPSAGR